MGIKRARTKEVKQINAADLAPIPAPVVLLEHIALPKKQKSTQMLTGTPREIATALVEKLRTEAHIL
jgi:electron transfer flavoprotein beta subunit